MRDARQNGETSVLAWLIGMIVAGFVLQNVFTRVFQQGYELEGFFALSPAALRAWHLWTPLTYSFLHAPDNLLHILGNLLALFFLGRALLPVLGARKFLWLYGTACVVGGLAWAAVHWRSGGLLLGASAGVASLLIVFACLYPDREMTFLLFFVVPVTVKPKYVALACVSIDVFGCIFYEIVRAAAPFTLAHSAHLGGMAVGWLYHRLVHEGWRPRFRQEVELPRWAKRPRAAAPKYEVDVGKPGDLRAEVDRILDKINSRGFGALTPEEKRLLDEARDLLSRR